MRSPSKKTLHAAEQDRPDVAAARADLKAEQPSLDAQRLVFIDETAVTTKMVRHYGRSPRGERLVAKGDIVFMDNLRTHKVHGVREAVEAVGAIVRYLPAYSPDLNPIEQVFAKLKAALRKGAARTVIALIKLIGRLIKTFAPDECANYFRHAGYGI